MCSFKSLQQLNCTTRCGQIIGTDNIFKLVPNVVKFSIPWLSKDMRHSYDFREQMRSLHHDKKGST